MIPIFDTKKFVIAVVSPEYRIELVVSEVIR